MFFTLQNTTKDWGYFTEKSNDACLGMKNGCYWPMGKLLGGSSAINAMMYVRGNRRDYDHWSELGNESWDWDSVIEYFKKSEDNQDEYLKINGKKHHGVGGPLKVSYFHSGFPVHAILAESFFEMGYKELFGMNADKYLGVTNTQVTAFQGSRFSAAKAFLLPAKDRPNLHIVKNAHATNLVYELDGSVKGVQYLINKSHLHLSLVRKEVVLSAGTVNTPKLLMSSGIGPKDLLNKFEIEVVKDLPVGKNLQDHVTIPYFLSIAKSWPWERITRDIVDMVYNYHIHRTGDLSNIGATDFTVFVSTIKDPKYPDIQYNTFYAYKNEPMLATVLNLFGYQDEIVDSILAVNRNTEVIVLAVTLLNPKSTGKIELRSIDPFDPPKIYHNYLTEQEDIDTLLRGIRILRNISNTESFKTQEGEVIQPKLSACDTLVYDSDEYWVCYIRYMSTTLYHPTGTAKMGPDGDEEAVVDSKLRVRGVKKLRVADASIMPKIVSGNTNAPAIMIGEKAADFIKEEHGEKEVN